LYPFPENKVKTFLKNLKEVVVIEELDPFIEEEIRKLTNIKIHGKEIFPETGELRPEHVLEGISKILKKPVKKYQNADAPARKPLFCAGCPHRSTFYAIKKTLGTKKIFGGDIGCYMLGALEPYEMNDWVVSMGASIGIGHGVSKATDEKPVIFIGDGTFFHAGIPALINLVFNKADALVVVLDNRLTAMTGHQPNPGTGWTGMNEPAKRLLIEDIAKACQADSVKISSVWNFNQLCNDIQEAYSKKGVSVLVAKGECRLFAVRNLAKQGKTWPRFEITKQKPELDQLSGFRCPAIQKDNKSGKWFIDKRLCWGCTICRQLFPDCIEVAK
jgi:indolepyruvate ferredoxin oxidoreductase alpha subunit